MTRKAVTLLEVMFALGIVSVGILGVLLVLALAGRQAATGERIDTASRLGKSAVQEFHVRSMNMASPGKKQTWAINSFDPSVSYCLDPIFVGQHGSASPACYFPAFDPATVPGPRMTRISLRAVPWAPNIAPVAWSGDLAWQVFGGHDDLLFSLPSDRNELPVGLTPSDSCRKSADNFSWFATITSHPTEFDSRLLSIVVCHRRNLDMQTERIVDVAFDPWITSPPPPCSVAQHGGMVRLSPRPGRPLTDLDIEKGDWLLLAGENASGKTRFAWYRVMGVMEMTASDTSREAMIFGPDWNLDFATQAMLFTDIVFVYEKTTWLDDSGMF